MRSFRFHFHIPASSFSIQTPFGSQVGVLRAVFPRAEGGLAEIQINDLRAVIHGASTHIGLSAQVDLPGDDLDTARCEAERRLQAHLSLAVLQSDATIGQPLLWIGYEATPGVPTTEFIQIERDEGEVQFLSKRKRALNHDDLARLADAFYRNTDPHIGRAIRWYRKGLSEDDPFDQFMNYWNGLEALNKPLMGRYGVDPETGTCKHCGAVYEKPPTNQGIRGLFLQHAKRGKDDFKQCRDLRVDLQHGGGSFVDIADSVAECAELCRIMLRLGIHLLLGYGSDEAESSVQPVYNIFEPYTELRGYFRISPENLEGVPTLTVSSEVVSIDSTDERRRVSIRQVVDSDIHADVEISAVHYREAGIELKSVEVGTVPNIPPSSAMDSEGC